MPAGILPWSAVYMYTVLFFFKSGALGSLQGVSDPRPLPGPASGQDSWWKSVSSRVSSLKQSQFWAFPPLTPTLSQYARGYIERRENSVLF